MMDEASDCGHIEQVSFVVCYIDSACDSWKNATCWVYE